MLAISSLLFVAGSRPDRFAKAAQAGADLTVIDLEDAVAAPDKAAARQAAMAFVAEHAQTALRINGLRTMAGLEDVLALAAAPARPAALLVPMVDHPVELEILRDVLADRLPPLVPLVETPRALHAVDAIATAPGVAALMFGGGDYCGELGVPMGWDAMLYPRTLIANACAAARIAAIDVPSLVLDDPDAVEAEARRVAALGFVAKAAIHPSQVSAIHTALRPSVAQVEEARGALAAYAAGGERAIRYKGRMLEAPVVKQLQAIIDRAGAQRHA